MKDEEIKEEKRILNLKKKGLEQIKEIINNFEQPKEVLKVKKSILYKIKQIDLSDNNLIEIPNEILKFPNLIAIDISKNQIQKIQKLIELLKKVENLKILNMELTNKDDVYLILSSLPNIEVLNDKKTREEIIINCKEIDINDEEVEGVSLNKDVNTYNLILKELQLIKNFNSDIKNQFQKILKNEIDKINSEIEIPNYLYATNILKAKSLVYNFQRFN